MLVTGGLTSRLQTSEVTIMNRFVRMCCVGALAILPATAAHSVPLGTGFSYQGQLIQNGTPVTGTVTLGFSLWDAVSGGTQVGALQVVPSVSVTNGLFVVQLNDASQFGASAFNGDARWLQVEVCTDASCSTSPTVLSPRQPINPTPYSRFSAGPWQLNGGALSFSGGNVGIGTATPNAPLELKSGFGTEVLRFGLDSGDYHFLSTGFHGAVPSLNFLGFNLEHGSNDTRRVLTMLGDGSVGIGTDSPAATLDVMGNIYLGTGPRYSVPGAEENLKMVRGSINANGTPSAGCCYSVSHTVTGSYDITFSTSFTATPSVTATTRGIFTVASTVALGPSSVRVNVYRNDASGGIDDNFDFIAIGPR
jgi:hypothetical protein